MPRVLLKVEEETMFCECGDFGFHIPESMSVRCGSLTFVRGTKPARNTGFDMDEDDLLEMEQCHGVLVASFTCLIWHLANELYLLFRKF
ncbi:hypothetical protein JHK82_023741 [Glycine max]|nr:hypothetical protein JHK87_023694 [Glycine soja]KAG5005759.1 hypothetical protein JHK85_024301 [Glycine max]KAG5011549.1 hypothetical protein JHK86_023810 [Glycine max]KAG5132553.1 hypothetical protein JHK82_023741 [Glycine max]